MTTTTATSVLRAAVLANAGFLHGFTTRLGGISPLPHGPLDLALQRDPETLAENQRRVARAVGFTVDRLRQVTQVHGARTVDAAAATPADEADALFAAPGSALAVAVRVADCVPLLIGDRSSGAAAAIHAGWRGVEAGVVASAVARFAERRELVCAIGPSIGACCFEVGLDVGERISNAAGVDAIDRHAGDKAFVDLRRAVRATLVRLGVDDASIEDVPGCTRCDAERFHSFRRDGSDSGRLLGVIVARSAGAAG